MVDRNDLSPNSAANTKPNILKTRALLFIYLIHLEGEEVEIITSLHVKYWRKSLKSKNI
jgi:hypothetical protein